MHDAWRLFREDVCQRFLERLRVTVESRLREEPFSADTDLRVRCRYDGRKKYSNVLWITSGVWGRNEDTPSNEDGRSAIKLQSGKRGPNSWYWGVSSPTPESRMTEQERECRAELVVSLRRHGLALKHGEEEWWLSWEWVPQHGDWDHLVPELHEECEAGTGRITDSMSTVCSGLPRTLFRLSTRWRRASGRPIDTRHAPETVSLRRATTDFTAKHADVEHVEGQLGSPLSRSASASSGPDRPPRGSPILTEVKYTPSALQTPGCGGS